MGVRGGGGGTWMVSHNSLQKMKNHVTYTPRLLRNGVTNCMMIRATDWRRGIMYHVYFSARLFGALAVY